jgi:hypothetical protein
MLDAMGSQLATLSGPLWQFIEQFAWIGEKSAIFTWSPLDAMLNEAASGAGMAPNLIKYMVTLVLAYPLSFIFGLLVKYSPGTYSKHIYSGIIGIYFLQWVFASDWIHSFISAILTFIICSYAPKKITGKLTMYTILSYMILCHAYKMYTNYLSGLPYWQFPLDFTGVQMVLTMKLTSFGYNVQDGHTPGMFLEASKDKLVDKKSIAQEKTRKARAKFAITMKTMPNLIEFLGYVYHFSTLMVGPTFEYTEYIKVVDGSVLKVQSANNVSKMGNNIKTLGAVEDTHKPVFLRTTQLFNQRLLVASLHRFIVGILSLIAYLTLSGNGFSTYWAYDLNWIASQPNMLHRFLFIYVCLVSERFKFYFIWKMSEGANILGGFGYTSDHTFRGCENIDIMGFEFSTTIQALSRAWNKGTQTWLERYTYSRTNRSLTATYFVSAIWHGIYPGFFFFFLSVPLLTQIERLFQTKVNTYIVPTYHNRDITTYPTNIMGNLYWFCCYIGKTFVMNFVTQTFSMGYLSNSLIALGSYHWYPHIFFVGLYVVLLVVPPATAKKKKE